jgi:hypothetical protein
MKNRKFRYCLLIILLIGNSAIGQIISGKVYINNFKNPAVGAAVMIKGTNNGVYTDIEGYFSLEIDSLDCVLNISLSNYSNKEIKLISQNDIKLSLENRIIDLVDFEIVAFTSIDEKDKKGGVWAESISGINKLWIIGENCEWGKTIFENMDYPLIAAENGIEGDVYVRFSIDTLGVMQDFMILNKDKVDMALMKKVSETFEKMPKWTQNDIAKYKGIGGFFYKGKYWTGIYTFTIKFRLEKNKKLHTTRGVANVG